MTYELAKQLKDAGFPQNEAEKYWIEYIGFPHKVGIKRSIVDKEDYTVNAGLAIAIPTLSELIAACGDGFAGLNYYSSMGWWEAFEKLYYGASDDDEIVVKGSNPEEAVAKLWLALNKKND